HQSHAVLYYFGASILSTLHLPPDEDEYPQPPARRRWNWKRIVVWLTVSLAVLTTALLIGAVVLLHKPAFRQYLLQVVYTKLREASGVELRMRDFAVHLSGVSPAVDMYDVVIDGAPPYQTQPLAKADHLSVSVQIVSLFQRTWYLKDIVVDHPVVRVFVGDNG